MASDIHQDYGVATTMMKRFLKAFLGGDPKTWAPENASVYIECGSLSARVIPFGAALQDLRILGHDHSMVLGFEDPDAYRQHSPYFGAIAGRYANRIAQAALPLGDQTHRLDPNFLGRHTLHGGAAGFGKLIWTVDQVQDAAVTLSLVSPDGDMGFPGQLSAKVIYEVLEECVLRITIEAHADATTVCNLAHHSYFNLDGTPDILDHQLQIHAQHYLPVDAELIPTGEIAPVAGTPFDFQSPRLVRQEADGSQIKIDHNYCMEDRSRRSLQHMATLTGAKSGLAMQVWSTEPGVQFYDGAKVNTSIAGLSGAPYGAHAGLCLEPQFWPNSPHHAEFPSAELRPGEIYRQITELRFLDVF